MEGDSGEESPLHLFCLFVVLIYSIKTLFDLMSIIMVCYWLFCVNSKLNFADLIWSKYEFMRIGEVGGTNVPRGPN